MVLTFAWLGTTIAAHHGTMMGLVFWVLVISYSLDFCGTKVVTDKSSTEGVVSEWFSIGQKCPKNALQDGVALTWLDFDLISNRFRIAKSVLKCMSKWGDKT